MAANTIPYGVNPVIQNAMPSGVGGGFSNVGTYVAPASYAYTPPPQIAVPVMSGGISAVGGGFGGYGGFL